MEVKRGFDQFWAIYPKKVHQKEARRAWGKIPWLVVTVEEILTAVELQTRHLWRGKDPQYIPNPDKWIRGERWNDEIARAKGAVDVGEMWGREPY